MRIPASGGHPRPRFSVVGGAFRLGFADPAPPFDPTARSPRCFPGETASGFPRTPISGCARKDVCGYHAPLIFRRPAFDAACFAAASALAALLLALRSLGPKVLWAHLRRFKRLGAADAALVPRLAAQNRSHAGCALGGDRLASSGRRRFADFRCPHQERVLQRLLRTYPYSSVPIRTRASVRDRASACAPAFHPASDPCRSFISIFRFIFQKVNFI